ncbi:MAG: MFS transporter [Candidatus Ranarchaeia archaeon]
MEQTDRYRWVMLALSFCVTLLFAIGLQQIPPLLMFLVGEAGLSYTQVGSLMSAYSGPGLVVAIGWGVLMIKYGIRQVTIVTMFLFVAGNTLVAFAPTYPVLITGRFISGVGAQALPTVGASTMAQWFRGKELGLALGVYTSAVPLGTIIPLNTYGIIGLSLGWRFPLLLTSVFGAILLASVLWFYKPVPLAEDAPITRQYIFRVLHPILPIGVAWMFFQGTGLSFSTFGPSYFQQVGYPLLAATMLTSSWMLGSLFFGPLIGKALDRRDDLPLIMLVGSFLIAVALVMFILIPSYAFQGALVLAIGAAIVPTCIFVITPRRLTIKESNIGFSLLTTFASLGSAVGPLLTGMALDISGVYLPSFLLMIIFSVVTGIFTLPLKKHGRTREP